MTTKWTIRKYDGFLRWKVFAPGGEPPKTAFAQQLGFLTFPDALTYVESQIRKARTVEVVLPKVEDWKVLPSKRQRVDLTGWGTIVQDTTSDYEDSGGYVCITDSDLKPLALHLLALHYEKENNE